MYICRVRYCTAAQSSGSDSEFSSVPLSNTLTPSIISSPVGDGSSDLSEHVTLDLNLTRSFDILSAKRLVSGTSVSGILSFMKFCQFRRVFDGALAA